MFELKKIDYILSLIIGELSAVLMLIIGGNLVTENPALAVVEPYLVYFVVVFPVLCVAGLFVAHFLSRWVSVIFQFAKFVLVGGLNFLVDLGILSFLVFFTGISIGWVQSAFKGVSFIIAGTNSYLWNRGWVFKRDKPNEKIGKEFFQFFLVTLVGFVINISVDYFFVNMVSPFWGMPAKSWTQFSAMLSAIVSLGWNFVGYKFLVFGIKEDTASVSIKTEEKLNDKNSIIS